MRAYITENREEIFENAQISDLQIAKFVKLFDSSFIDLCAIRSMAQEDVDLYMKKRLENIKTVLGVMKKNQPEHFAILEKVYNAENRSLRFSDLGDLSVDVADELLRLNFLAHDRLTLEAMAIAVKNDASK
jgi:hypothetical protein